MPGPVLLPGRVQPDGKVQLPGRWPGLPSAPPASPPGDGPTPVIGATTTRSYVGGTTTVDVPVPSGTAAGVIVVVHLLFESITVLPTGITAEDGTWNLESTKDQNNGSLRDQIWWKRCSGTDTGTYDWTWTTTCERTSTATVVTGCIATGSPFDTGSDHETATAVGSNTPDVAMTTLGANRRLFWTGSGINGSSDWTQPSGFTEDFQGANITVADKEQVAAGSTGTISGSNTSSDEKLAFLGALKPTFTAGGGGTNVDVNLATETDTAQAIGRQKSRTLGQATTNETAQAFIQQKRVTIGTAIETTTAQPIARQKSRTLGIATEANTATALTEQKRRTLAVATETDTATALARTKQRLVGWATETDTATRFVLPARITFGPAVETDTATALGRRKSKIIGPAISDEYGGPGLLFFDDSYHPAPGFTPVKMRGIGRATETDSGQPFNETKTRPVNLATETDTATVLGRRKQRVFGPALEANTATALTETKQRILNRATETDTATALARRKERLVGRAIENDIAQGIQTSGIKNIPVNRALETDTAQPIGRQKFKSIGIAVETNTAFAYTRRKQRTFGPALDSQIAQPMGRAKSKTINRAQETSSAFAMARRKLRVVGTALETDTAIPILRLGGQEPEPYVRPSGDITDSGGSGNISRGRPAADITRVN